MLEVKNLCKTYRPRRSVEVRALQDISIKFPETGMVFLLGRSGSGKSTLLNLLGGLDRYDSGEIVIDEVSTKSFSQADFDSYRNACLGFVFQEYNVLPEFNVGVNIALALELQGKTATSGEIEKILDEVDLNGYAKRRPNELSGGQLQRVAIARALVKNPKIILADEPTGALDSATGKQVFDTLKKLSQTKLVIIVSHDREYSELYADRIIELADGRIISDVTKAPVSGEETKKMLLDDGVCRVPGGYELTAEDREQINRYIAEHPEEQLRIRVDSNLTKGFSFEPTGEVPEGTGKKFFDRIRSKLPMRRAARIGVGGLKSKKVKLVFTVLMSMLAFSMFGLAATVADYNYVKTVSKAFRTENVRSVFVEKEVKTAFHDTFGRQEWRTSPLTDDREMEALRNQTGVSVNPVYKIGNMRAWYDTDSGQGGGNNMMFEILEELNFSSIDRWMEVDEDLLELYGCKLLEGELPDGSKDEVLISKVMYDMMLYSALANGSKLPKMSDIIGTTVSLSGGEELVVTGILDTGLNYMSYVNRMTELYGKMMDGRGGLGLSSLLSEAMAMVVASDFQYDVKSNPASCNLVGKGFVERHMMARFSSAEKRVVFTVEDDMTNVIPLLADIASIDVIPHLDFQDPADGGKDVVTCYVSRDLARRYLMNILSSNNRIYLGIDETIKEYSRKPEDDGFGDPDGDGTKPKDDNYDDPYDDPYYDEPYFEDDNGKYGIGDGTEFRDSVTATMYERRENRRYLTDLNDSEMLALLERVCKLTEVKILCLGDYDYYYGYYDVSYDDGYSDGTRKTTTLNIIGMLPSEKDGKELEFGYAIVGDPKELEVIGSVNMPYCGAMVRLPENRRDLDSFIEFTHEGDGEFRYQMQTKYNVEIDAADIAMSVAGKVLVGIGIFFAVFAALLMTSFIANSIVYKKREVGILRAIGSRGADVYRIFGSEACAVALICAIMASILTAVLAGMANYYIIRAFHVSLMEFGMKQILLIFAVAFGTAMIASFLPVYLFARKRPIDAIRGR
ncbi:MAG: ATP-binding cassette domain-containing protein [Lachnospiraceae bacterium]|nr:ATP-binding cassette domain-containing protein [Lachnospiraceae bacterium]